MIRFRQSYVVAVFILLQQICAIEGYSQVDSNSIDHFVAVPTLSDSNFVSSNAYHDALRARIKNDEREEERLLLMAIAYNPKEAGAYYDLSRINSKQNKTDRATEYIQKAIALSDSNIWYKRQYAEILILANKFEEAADQLMRIAKLDKYNEDDIYKAAKLYQHVGKYDQALVAVDMLLKKDEWNEEALAQKKSLYLKKNDVEGAANVIKQQIENNPREGKYYAELAELYENNRMAEKAEKYFKQAEKEFGEDAIVQLSLAGYYKRKDNKAKYIEFARKLITNKGIDADQQLVFLSAYILETQNDTARMREGVELCKKIVEGTPDNASAHKFYGDILRMNGKDTEALEAYKTSIQIDQSAYNTWEALLLNYLTPASADSVIKYSEKALRLFPNQARLHYFNGIGYTFKKDYAKAVKSLSRAIDMLPEGRNDELSDMYSSLGDAYNYLKQYQLSDESYDNALKLVPENVSVLNNYAYYLSVRNVRLDDAERMSKKTLEVRKDDPTFLDTYGWICYKQGKNDKALDYIQKAIDLSGTSSDGTLWEHLGDIHFKMGSVEKAVECWKKAKEKGTDNPDIDKKINDRKLYES